MTKPQEIKPQDAVSTIQASSSEIIRRFLDQVKQHDEAATKGPWYARDYLYEDEVGVEGGLSPTVLAEQDEGEGEFSTFSPLDELSEDDARAIAFSRTALPKAGKALQMAVEGLTAWLDEHKRVYGHLFECPPADCSWDIQRKNVENTLAIIARILEEEK